MALETHMELIQIVVYTLILLVLVPVAFFLFSGDENSRKEDRDDF